MWLSAAYARAGAISRWNPALYLVALGIAVGGAALGQVTDVIDGRTIGVLALWTVAAAQLWLAAVIWRER